MLRNATTKQYVPPVIDPLQTKISCGEVGRDKEFSGQRRIQSKIEAKQGRGKIGYWSFVHREVPYTLLNGAPK